MKILYAVQATGNGHISRAMEVLPYLEEYGTVDIFLSGDNSNLVLDAPVKFRSKGLSLYYNCSGGLDYWQMVKGFQPQRIRQEIKDLPVEKYDLVINDFEYITSIACAKKKVPSVNFGHQASFQSALVPRPAKRNWAGEYILKNYAKASRYIGLHFKRYDDFIFPPVIKKEVLEARVENKNHITVYLPSWCEPQLRDVFKGFADFEFQIFCRQTPAITREGNLLFFPVNKQLFNTSLANSTGIITGAGFETPAEAIHLGKKLMVIPIRGQYEQLCNAAALSEIGVTSLKRIDAGFENHFYSWINDPFTLQLNYENVMPQCLAYLFSTDTFEPMDEIDSIPHGLLSFLF